MNVEQNDDVEMSMERARDERDEEEFTPDASRLNATQDVDVDFTESDPEPETGFSKETEDLFGPDSDEEISISDAAAAPEPSPNDNNRSAVSSNFNLDSFSNATVNETLSSGNKVSTASSQSSQMNTSQSQPPLSTELDMDAQLDADLNATWDAIIGTGNDDASSESSQTITPGSQSQFEISLEVDLDVDMGPTREGHFEAENDTNSQLSEMFIPEHSQSQSASSPEPDVEADLHEDTEMPTQNIEQQQQQPSTNTTTNNIAEPAPEAATEPHWELPPQNLPIYFVVKKASGSIKRFGPIDLLISPSEMKFGSLMTKARHFIEQGDPKQSENFDLESQNYDVREFLKEEGVRFEGNWWREMGLSVVWVGRSNDGEDGVLSLIKSDVEFGKVCRTVTLGWGVRWVVQFEVV